MSSATKKRSTSKQAAATAAAASAEKPAKRKSSKSIDRKQSGTSQDASEAKTRARLTIAQVENVSIS